MRRVEALARNLFAQVAAKRILQGTATVMQLESDVVSVKEAAALYAKRTRPYRYPDD